MWTQGSQTRIAMLQGKGGERSWEPEKTASGPTSSTSPKVSSCFKRSTEFTLQVGDSEHDSISFLTSLTTAVFIFLFASLLPFFHLSHSFPAFSSPSLSSSISPGATNLIPLCTSNSFLSMQCESASATLNSLEQEEGKPFFPVMDETLED